MMAPERKRELVFDDLLVEYGKTYGLWYAGLFSQEQTAQELARIRALIKEVAPIKAPTK